MNDPIFHVDHLSLEYRRHRRQFAVSILKDVSFILERGGQRQLLDSSSMYSHPQAFETQFTAA